MQQEAYLAYWTENAMGQRAFPSMKKLECEVMEMGLSLLHAPANADCNVYLWRHGKHFSSREDGARLGARNEGHRDAEYGHAAHRTPRIRPRGGVSQYPSHPGEDDAKRLPRRCAEMERRIDKNTIMLMGSAPNYPYGVFDQIGEIAALAATAGLVDACRCVRRRVPGAVRPQARL